MKRKLFCSKKCVYAYVRDDAEMVVCCMCRHPMQFYKCIRRCYDDRCFCSLGCIEATEHNIERVLCNDERFHLDISNFKCKSNDVGRKQSWSINDFVYLDCFLCETSSEFNSVDDVPVDLPAILSSGASTGKTHFYIIHARSVQA